MFFPTSMISLMVTFRTFYFPDFLADLLQNPSQLPVICSPVVCLVSMFLPHIVKYFGLKPGTKIYLFYFYYIKIILLTLWSRSLSKEYLIIQSVPQREYYTSPLQQNAVQGNNLCLQLEPYKTQKYKIQLLLLKQLVHIVTIWL
jgi:hypothetical protein